MADKPMVFLVGTYSKVEDATSDYDSVMSMHKEGDLGHVAAAILTKDAEGKLKIRRHDTTAKHLAWGGVLVGGLIGVLSPPLGVTMVTTTLAGEMATAGVIDAGILAGLGGVMGHYWRNIPKQDLRELGDTLEAGNAALVVVAVDKQQAEIEKAIMKADRRVAKRLMQADVEAAFDEAVQDSKKAA